MVATTHELNAKQLANLHSVTDAALAHLRLDDLLNELLARVVDVLNADTAAILLLDEEQEKLVARAAHGLEEEVEQGVQIPIGGGFAGRVAAERRAIAVEDIRQVELLNPLLLERGIHSLLGVPLLVEGDVIGVLHVGSFKRRRFSEDDVHLLQLVADRSAIGIDHARTKVAHGEAERALARLANLQSVTDAALAHLRLDNLLNELLAQIVDILKADTATILLLDEEQEKLVARAAHGLEEEILLGVEIPLGGGFAGRVAAERRAIAVEDIRQVELLNPLLLERGLHSLLGVPLLVEGNVIGVLHVGSLKTRRFSEDDVHLLQLVADRSALAIDHARVYERNRTVAEVLQRSLLPDRLPEVPGTALAARYLPARDEPEIGGDWYDVIPLREGKIGVAIGDVVGHGVAAAALMGDLRSALRAYALEGHSPSVVLERMNRLMRRVTPGAMATLIYVVFDVETATLRFANAGHPPPLVRRADGTASFLDQVSAQPLGVAEYAAFEEGDDALEAGSALLLCTDGLVERRSESFEAGLARLADTVLSGPEAPSDLCDHVLAATVPATGGEDDVAIVVLHALPPPGERMQLRLAADPDELADIRRLLGRWLHIFQAEPDEAYEITVACTEACANAIEHAYSPGEASFELEALLRDGEVAITVRDTGRWRPPRGHHRGRGLQIMESFMDAVDVTRDDAGTTVQLRRRLAGRAA